MKRMIVAVALLVGGLCHAQDTTKFRALTLPGKAKLIALTVPVYYATDDSSLFAFADGQDLSLASNATVGVIAPAKPQAVPTMAYQNPFDLGTVTKNTITPFAITFLKLPASGTEIISVKRFVFGLDGSSVNMTSVAVISGQRVTVPNVWMSIGDTPPRGRFRIQVIAKSSDGAVQDEANVIGLLTY
jgi:hypothetical protein